VWTAPFPNILVGTLELEIWAFKGHISFNQHVTKYSLRLNNGLSEEKCLQMVLGYAKGKQTLIYY